MVVPKALSAIHVPNGSETFYGENRGDLRKFTHDVIDSGADLVIGHGPHVFEEWRSIRTNSSPTLLETLPHMDVLTSQDMLVWASF